MKKIFSLFLVLVFMISISSVAFASNEHKVTVDVPASSTTVIAPGDDPDIWGQETEDLDTGYSLYLLPFIIPDHYFAYEFSATGAPSSVYTVSLMYQSIAAIASGNGYANGTNYKIDWISVTTGGQYCFRIINNTGSTIHVTITYYSWA